MGEDIGLGKGKEIRTEEEGQKKRVESDGRGMGLRGEREEVGLGETVVENVGRREGGEGERI